ncbi:MAG: transporter substrate-binding domain-containing protein [Xanthobacteraceae bacterium]
MLLKVGAALPDPPFELMTKDGPIGFDITLMQCIAAMLNREWQLVPYKGTDFNGIFAGLNDGSYDCIASGATITPGRQKLADFCRPMSSPASRSSSIRRGIPTSTAPRTSKGS